MKRFLDSGGSILVLAGEGGESRFDTNINFFLEEYGINVNSGENVEILLNNIFVKIYFLYRY